MRFRTHAPEPPARTRRNSGRLVSSQIMQQFEAKRRIVVVLVLATIGLASVGHRVGSARARSESDL